jgi:DNA-binding transcriptional regulator/RsmH inhibitor MraZ
LTKDREIPNLNFRDLYESLLQCDFPHSERDFQPTLDASFSGALLLPTGFACGSSTIVATAGWPQCVLLLNNEHWEAICAKLIGMTGQGNLPLPPAMQAFRNLLLGNAVELEIGASGIVELPIHLLEYGQIKEKIRSLRHGVANELVRVAASHPLGCLSPSSAY